MNARLTVGIASLLATAAAVQTPPPGFVPPSLHPEGVRLRTEAMGEGVYALLSSKPPVDNAGFDVGERGVLVIDAHIDKTMAQQILDAVREVTDKPILYLVNTNYLADHTFENFVFPETTHVVAHRKTEILMRRFDQQKKGMLVTVRNDSSVFASAELRLPDIVFDDYLAFDLGGRTVELYHFGAGNTLGDTVVYVPATKVAWTGNLVFRDGSLPFLLAGQPTRYASTVAHFAEALDVETIVPGHGVPTNSTIFARYLDYLENLVYAVRSAHRENWTLEQTLERVPLADRFAIAFELSSAAFYTSLHPYNLKRSFLEAQK